MPQHWPACRSILVRSASIARLASKFRMLSRNELIGFGARNVRPERDQNRKSNFEKSKTQKIENSKNPKFKIRTKFFADRKL
jgi:hypothetical protein